MNPLELMAMMRMSNNPQMALQQMLGQNPIYQRALAMAQGKNETQLRETACNLCRQRGMSPEEIESLFKQFGL